MPRPERDAEFLFYSTVDDELYEELSQLQGEEIVHLAVWEDSLAEGMPGTAGSGGAGSNAGGAAENASSGVFDIDIYLGGGVYFELYSVAAFDDPDEEPYDDRDLLEARLRKLVAQGASLGEVAVDEEDALVLVFYQGRKPAIFLAVGGWVLEEWDELPV